MRHLWHAVLFIVALVFLAHILTVLLIPSLPYLFAFLCLALIGSSFYRKKRKF